MNQDELAALAALQRSLGWKLLVREHHRMREDAVKLAMNPDSDLNLVDRTRRHWAGVEEVIGWPQRQLDAAPAQEVVRAGLMQAPAEEEANAP